MPFTNFFFRKLITNSRKSLGSSSGIKSYGINRQAVWLHNHNKKLGTAPKNCDCPPGWTAGVDGCSNESNVTQPCGSDIN